MKLSTADAHKIAAYLARVIPRGPDEADDLHNLIVRLGSTR